MATISYTPSTIAGTFATLADIRSVYATNGVRTGFGFYTNGTTPAYFTTNNAFMNALADEGFFTGSNPKVFYTPEQAATLLAKAFVLDGAPMYGIEYKMRTEGFTVGDFMSGMVQHSAGDSTAIIIGNMQMEGYVTGLQGILSPADAALFDSQCVDGRCIGSGCMAPTVYHMGPLTVTADNTPGDWGATVTDSVAINLPFDARAILFLSLTCTDLTHHWGTPPQGAAHEWKDVKILVDAAEILAPRLYYAVGTNNYFTPETELPVGMVNLAGGVSHTIEVSAMVGTYPDVMSYYLNVWVMIMKQAC